MPLTKDQFFNINAGYDQFGRARGYGFQWETGRTDALGREVMIERSGRVAAELIEQDVADAAEAKRLAPSNDLATEADRAWSDLKVAQSHLMLVEKFERDSADWRVEANRLAAMPGGMERSEQARRQAERLAEIAERHRQAATRRQAQGMQEAAEVRKKLPPKPPPAPPHQQPPRPGGGPAMPRPRAAGRREPGGGITPAERLQPSHSPPTPASPPISS